MSPHCLSLGALQEVSEENLCVFVGLSHGDVYSERKPRGRL